MISLPDQESEVAPYGSAEVDRRLASTRRAPPPPPRDKTHWPIYDLALVALCVGLFLAAAITAWQRSARAHARERLIADFAAAEAAFLTYLQVHGTAPADAPPGELPPGMKADLLKFDWTAPSALGGHFRWSPLPPPPANAAGETPPAAPGGTLTLTAFPSSPPLQLTPADFLELDRRLDDGDPATGKLRAGFNGWPELRVQIRR